MSNRPRSQTTRARSRAADTAATESRTPLVWIGVAAIVAIAVVVGVLVSLGGDEGGEGSDWALETGFAETIGARVPTAGSGSPA